MTRINNPSIARPTTSNTVTPRQGAILDRDASLQLAWAAAGSAPAVTLRTTLEGTLSPKSGAPMVGVLLDNAARLALGADRGAAFIDAERKEFYVVKGGGMKAETVNGPYALPGGFKASEAKLTQVEERAHRETNGWRPR